MNNIHLSKINNYLNRDFVFGILISLVLLIPNIITFCIFYPGYFQADHQTSIIHFLLGNPSHGHSYFWTILACPFLTLFKSYSVYGIAQIIYFCFTVFFSLFLLYRHKIILSKKIIVIITLVYAVCPCYLLYNLLYSSDMMFAYTLILIMSMLAVLVLCKDKKQNISFYIFLFVLIIIACLLRKNALLILIFLPLVTFFIKNIKNKGLIFVCSLFSFIFVILGAPFTSSTFNVAPSPSQEMMSVPSVQVAAVYRNNGSMSDESKEVFESYHSEEYGKLNTEKNSADSSKMDLSLTLDFLKAGIDTGLRNKITYLNAYGDLEMYYYLPYGDTVTQNGIIIDFAQFDIFTIYPYNDSSFENKNTEIVNNYLSQFGIQHDKFGYLIPGIINHLSDNPLLGFILNFIIFNRALPLGIFVLCICIILVKKQFSNFLFYSVVLYSVLLSLLLFSPVCLMRYSMEMYYCLPLLIYFCVKIPNNNKHIKIWISKIKDKYERVD